MILFFSFIFFRIAFRLFFSLCRHTHTLTHARTVVAFELDLCWTCTCEYMLDSVSMCVHCTYTTNALFMFSTYFFVIRSLSKSLFSSVCITLTTQNFTFYPYFPVCIRTFFSTCVWPLTPVAVVFFPARSLDAL